MRATWHAASAVPFAAAGHWWLAIGCVLPDVTWLRNELRYRASGVRDFQAWVRIAPERWITPYRWAHSVPAWLAAWALLAWLCPSCAEVCLGALVHVALDLPTHEGRMRQIPLYPCGWRWPWTW